MLLFALPLIVFYGFIHSSEKLAQPIQTHINHLSTTRFGLP